MLDHFEDILDELGWQHELATITTGEGEDIEALLFRHGPFKIFAYERGSILIFDLWLGFEEEEAQPIAELPDDLQNRVFRAIRRELTKNPTVAYQFDWRDRDAGLVHTLHVKERVVLDGSTPDQVQKVSDRAQSVVNGGIAALEVLRHTFDNVDASVEYEAPYEPSRPIEVH